MVRGRDRYAFGGRSVNPLADMLNGQGVAILYIQDGAEFQKLVKRPVAIRQETWSKSLAAQGKKNPKNPVTRSLFCRSNAYALTARRPLAARPLPRVFCHPPLGDFESGWTRNKPQHKSPISCVFGFFAPWCCKATTSVVRKRIGCASLRFRLRLGSSNQLNHAVISKETLARGMSRVDCWVGVPPSGGKDRLKPGLQLLNDPAA